MGAPGAWRSGMMRSAIVPGSLLTHLRLVTCLPGPKWPLNRVRCRKPQLCLFLRSASRRPLGVSSSRSAARLLLQRGCNVCSEVGAAKICDGSRYLGAGPASCIPATARSPCCEPPLVRRERFLRPSNREARAESPSNDRTRAQLFAALSLAADPLCSTRLHAAHV